MTEAAIALFALAYSATVLFALASALRKRIDPRRAAWTALGISTAVHAATLYGVPDEHRGLALAFWAVPHLIIAPILLWMARPSQG